MGKYSERLGVGYSRHWNYLAYRGFDEMQRLFGRVRSGRLAAMKFLEVVLSFTNRKKMAENCDNAKY